jgi:hypothetical protein
MMPLLEHSALGQHTDAVPQLADEAMPRQTEMGRSSPGP